MGENICKAHICIQNTWAFLVAPAVENCHCAQETHRELVTILGQEDPWRRAWQLNQYSCLESIAENPVAYSSSGCRESNTTEATEKHISMHTQNV